MIYLYTNISSMLKQAYFQKRLQNKNQKLSPRKSFNPKTAGGWAQFELPSGFSKNFSPKERVKLWFFVTFNIVVSLIFPENFIGIPQVIQKL